MGLHSSYVQGKEGISSAEEKQSPRLTCHRGKATAAVLKFDIFLLCKYAKQSNLPRLTCHRGKTAAAVDGLGETADPNDPSTVLQL